MFLVILAAGHDMPVLCFWVFSFFFFVFFREIIYLSSVSLLWYSPESVQANINPIEMQVNIMFLMYKYSIYILNR